MQTGARLGAELATIGEQLEGSDGALALLRQAGRRLDRIASEHDRLAEALAALDRA
jgi:DNA repair protein RecN (Recombination protein N)